MDTYRRERKQAKAVHDVHRYRLIHTKSNQHIAKDISSKAKMILWKLLGNKISTEKIRCLGMARQHRQLEQSNRTKNVSQCLEFSKNYFQTVKLRSTAMIKNWNSRTADNQSRNERLYSTEIQQRHAAAETMDTKKKRIQDALNQANNNWHSNVRTPS